MRLAPGGSTNALLSRQRSVNTQGPCSKSPSTQCTGIIAPHMARAGACFMRHGSGSSTLRPGSLQLGRVAAKEAAPPTTLHSSINAPEPAQVPTPRSGPIVGPELGVLFKKFRRLQNGSDIRGIAMEGVPSEPVTLTPGAVFFIGQAFANWLKHKSDTGASPRVSVGRDPRISGPLMEAALVSGLASAGANVDTFGLATTPCMFYSIVHDDGGACCLSSMEAENGYQGAIMITASHMPWNANGLKFFTAEGGLEKADISELLQMATEACAQAGVMLGEAWLEGAHILAATRQLKGDVHYRDFRPVYAKSLRQLIIKGVGAKDTPSLPLLGCKIVVDAGNGAGGFFATEVLAPLGADISGSRYLEPDGSFPNHIPNPEHPSAMASGAEAVLQAGADLGIVFDTDVDRSAIVDRTGREINSNKFIALMSAIVLREHPGSTVVTDSVTSNGLSDFIASLGGKHFRFKRGYKNVISKGVQLNRQGVDTHLMMETSGHGAIKENYFLDDGAYLAVKVIVEAVRRRLAGEGDIGTLLAALAEPLEAREFRIRITDPDFQRISATVLERFHDWVASDSHKGPRNWQLESVNHEGWRVVVDEGDGKQGWALLRASLHDPLLVLNVESEVEGGAATTASQVLDFLLTTCQGLPLDLASLRSYTKDNK